MASSLALFGFALGVLAILLAMTDSCHSAPGHSGQRKLRQKKKQNTTSEVVSNQNVYIQVDALTEMNNMQPNASETKLHKTNWNWIKYYANNTKVQTKKSIESHIGLCPVNFSIDFHANRTPKHILHLKCKVQECSCSSRGQQYSCLQLKRKINVEFKPHVNDTGMKERKPKEILHYIGCICASYWPNGTISDKTPNQA